MINRFYAWILFLPTLGWNALLGRVLGRRNWWDPIDPYVLVGAYPFVGDVQRLYDLGVRAIVNTCEEYAGPVVHYNRLGIDQLHIPTTDFTHPNLRDIEQAVEFVEDHVNKKRMVYIHCKAGRARSATVAICWLMKYRGMSAAAAQAFLLLARPHINPNLAQRPVVQQFSKNLAAAKSKA